MPYRLDLIAQREADYVVAELVERNLPYLIQNVPLMPAPQRGEETPEGYAIYGSGIDFDVTPPEDLPGYTLVTGPLPTPQSRELPAAKPDSPVLVLGSDNGYYEAFLLEEGTVGLYLPDGVQPLGAAYIPA